MGKAADKPDEKPVKRKAGRPVTYTPAMVSSIITEVCRRLAQGEPLAVICRDDGMPDPATIWDWRQQKPEIEQAIARARLVGFDAIADEALVIADTPVEGVIEKLEAVEIANPDDPDLPPIKELQVVERRREDMLGHRRLQVETRLKLLAKWDPKRYGERLSHEHSGKIGLESIVAGDEPAAE